MVDFLYLFKDINFQKGFLLVAVLILLMVILNVAYKLNKEDDGGKVNPIVAPCPDYWDLSGAYCINTNGQNIGHDVIGKYSIWNAKVTCDDVGGSDPYTSITPIQCSDSDLKTIPVGSMYLLTQKKLVGGAGGIGDNYKKIQRKRTKASRTKWANKYGLVWDGLNTKW